MIVKKSSDCGNSPKNDLVQNIAIALFEGDVAFLNDVVSEDFEWQVSSAKTLTKIGASPLEVRKMTSIEIDLAISHGKSGTVSGVLKSNTSEKRFSIIIEFTSASGKKVRRATNYWLK